MCQQCVNDDPEYRNRLKEEWVSTKEQVSSYSSKAFADFLTAMENEDWFAVAKSSAALRSLFDKTATILSLIYNDDFLIKAAEEMIAHKKKGENQ